MSIFGDAWDDVKGAVEAPAKVVTDVVKSGYDATKDIVEAPVDATKDLLSGHPLQAFEDITEAPFKAGGELVSGAWHGIEDAAGGVFDELKAPFDAVDGLVKGLEGGQSKTAKAARSAASNADKLTGDAENTKVSAAKETLADTGDFASSDDVLSAGQPGIDFFHAFFPLYQQAAQYVSGAKNTKLNLQTDIDNRYNESKGIELSAFRGDAQNLTTLLGQVRSATNELSSSYGSLSSWTGSAASVASRYNENLLGKISGFLGGSGGSGATRAPAAITSAMTNIQNALKTYASNVLKLYSGQCGGQSPDTIADNIRKASGDLGIEDVGGSGFFSGMLDIAKDAFVGGLLGGGVGGIVGAFVGAFNGGADARKNIIKAAKQKLQAFVAEFDAKKSSFDGYVSSAEQQISSDYQTMLAGLKPLQTDPLQGVGDPGSFSSSATSTSSAGSPSSGGGYSGGGGAGGGGMGGGGAGGGGSTAPAGFTPPPISTSPTGDAGAPKPGSTPPGSTPLGSTPPGTGLTTTSSAGQPDALQISSDGNTIGMTAPNSQGTMKLSVDNGSGKPQTYDVNFGQGGLGVTTTSKGGTTRPGSTGADSAQEITPGPDGKAVIHDGKLTLTASEPDGPGGPVKLTVDNGSGHPETYTLDPGSASATSPSQTNPMTPADPGQGLTGTSATDPAWPTDYTGAGGAAGGGAPLGGGGGAALGGGGGAAPVGAISPVGHSSAQCQADSGGSYSSAAVDTNSGAADTPQGGAPAAAPAGAQHGGSSEGMPMMGGMGGMRGSQGGQDTEHKGGRWQTRGNLFDGDRDEANFSFRGVLGDKLPEQPPRGGSR